MSDRDMVGIPQIADRLGLDRTNVRRLIAKEAETLQLELHRGKGEKLLLSKEDAEKIIASYEARRGPISGYQLRGTPGAVNPESNEVTYDRYGYFYVIQLIPEALPNRVKIGFSDDPEKRLAEHRTAAPTAKLLKAWPCKRSWDYAAMDSITKSGCKLVLNEVYEGEIAGFVERGNAFFALMPDPDAEKELSEHSPLYDAIPRDDEKAAAAAAGAKNDNQ